MQTPIQQPNCFLPGHLKLWVIPKPDVSQIACRPKAAMLKTEQSDDYLCVAIDRSGEDDRLNVLTRLLVK
jgi:hypothetical protein